MVIVYVHVHGDCAKFRYSLSELLMKLILFPLIIIVFKTHIY